MKIHRLEEHIEWAAENHALNEIGQILRGLREDEWHHLRD